MTLLVVCTSCGYQWTIDWQPSEPGEMAPLFAACPSCSLQYGFADSEENPELARYYNDTHRS